MEVYPKVKVRAQQLDDENNSVKAFHSLSSTKFPSSGSLKNITKNIMGEDKVNIRASPIPRPRAVLSSPDNDVMIRSKNKKNVERTSALKNHDNLCPNKHHLHCKVITHPIAQETCRTAKRESKSAVDSTKTGLRGIKEPKSQYTFLRKGKPRSIHN